MQNSIIDEDYYYKIFKDINRVPESDWNDITQSTCPNIFMDFRFIKAVESSFEGLSKFWYIIIYSASGKPVGCACFSTLKVDLLIIAGGRIKKSGERIRTRFPSFMFFKVIMCGLPVSAGQNHLSIATYAKIEKVIEIIDAQLQKLTIQEKANFIIYKEFNKKNKTLGNQLAKFKYREGSSLPMYRLDNEFSNFREYMKALTAHYRYDIKRSKKKKIKGYIGTATTTNSNEICLKYTDGVHQLYENVVDRAENKLELLPKIFFHELSKNFQNQLSFTYLQKNNQILAFNFSLLSDHDYCFLFCGLDYSFNKEFDLYFNLMYEELSNGMNKNGKAIKLGQTAGIFKSRLGAYSYPLVIYIKGATLFTRMVLKLFFKVIFPKQVAPKLNKIFKTA